MPIAAHGVLNGGMEYGVLPLPHRRVVSFQLRVLAGCCNDPQEKLGLARLVTETIDKGTAKRSGKELSDAFDAIGAAHSSSAGRETLTFSCTVLPEQFERAVELHAEMLLAPSFPADAFRVNLDLARQELIALEDDAQGLADKLLARHTYGPVLGRHALGEEETLARISLEDVTGFSRQLVRPERMLLAVAGAIEPQRVADVFGRFFGDGAAAAQDGRVSFPVEFVPAVHHYDKELEQEQIGVGFPGVGMTHEEYPTQKVILGVLSGGMSGRLFTEVREKQGLVYWVSAWHETPRNAGMIFLGASTTPERCERTYATLLREVDRLAEDLAEDELQRAITGLVANSETRGDTTSAHCNELASDLFHFGRPVPREEKLARVQAVTIEHVKRYLATHPRDRRCVVTVGPKALAG